MCMYFYSVKLDKYYVGACEDIIQRMIRHNSGESVFTSRGIPWGVEVSGNIPGYVQCPEREMRSKKKSPGDILSG